MPIPITVVDAFTDRPFRGNPAAVVPARGPAGDERWMQSVAAEMNLSETAFLVPRADGGHDLRWFTPAVEVDLCGHATLASAHRPRAASGALPHPQRRAAPARDAGDGWIEMDFPAAARRRRRVRRQPLLAALGTTEVVRRGPEPVRPAGRAGVGRRRPRRCNPTCRPSPRSTPGRRSSPRRATATASTA